jgi:hypothetical protein
MKRYFATVRRGREMISLCNLSRGSVFTVLFAALAMLSGCVTSEEVLLNAVATPAKAGKYELQYHGDGKWTKFATGSLALVNRRYTWTENSEVSSLLNSKPDGFKFALVDTGNNYFIIVVASADLRNPIWVGNYSYGIARRAGGAFLYDFPSCLDLLVSQGLADYQIEKIEAHECQYSSKASLTSALTTYAKRTATWKRLAPSGH